MAGCGGDAHGEQPGRGRLDDMMPRSMRVAIDTSFLNRGHTGIGVYITRLLVALRTTGVDVVELSNPLWRPPAGGGLGSLRNYAVYHWWTHVGFPRRARAAGADLLHHPAPAISRGTEIPQVVTVQDLSFQRVPECYTRRYRVWASHAYRAAAIRADAVICSSETTARDMAALWGVPRGRITVAPYGPGQHGVRRVDGSIDLRHLLYIGDQEPRKNLARLLEAYGRYRGSVTNAVPLVLAGNVEDPGLPGVSVVHSPHEDRLRALLDESVALVHPSLHEGFGLTILEAMASGVPVVAALAPGVAETAGGAALGVDPYDPDAIATGIRRVAHDEALRRELAERGLKRAAEFSWEHSARQHLVGYELAVASGTRKSR